MPRPVTRTRADQLPRYLSLFENCDVPQHVTWRGGALHSAEGGLVSLVLYRLFARGSSSGSYASPSVFVPSLWISQTQTVEQSKNLIPPPFDARKGLSPIMGAPQLPSSCALRVVRALYL